MPVKRTLIRWRKADSIPQAVRAMDILLLPRWDNTRSVFLFSYLSVILFFKFVLCSQETFTFADSFLSIALSLLNRLFLFVFLAEQGKLALKYDWPTHGHVGIFYATTVDFGIWQCGTLCFALTSTWQRNRGLAVFRRPPSRDWPPKKEKPIGSCRPSGPLSRLLRSSARWPKRGRSRLYWGLNC